MLFHTSWHCVKESLQLHVWVVALRGWVMSYILREGVMSHTWRSHGTTWMSNVIYRYESLHCVNASCHYREWVILCIFAQCESEILHTGMSHCTSRMSHYIFPPSWEWHDSLMCMTWLICMRDVTWLTCECDMVFLICMRDVTWLTCECDVAGLICMCKYVWRDLTHLYVWCDVTHL